MHQLIKLTFIRRNSVLKHTKAHRNTVSTCNTQGNLYFLIANCIKKIQEIHYGLLYYSKLSKEKMAWYWNVHKIVYWIQFPANLDLKTVCSSVTLTYQSLGFITWKEQQKRKKNDLNNRSDQIFLILMFIKYLVGLLLQLGHSGYIKLVIYKHVIFA